MGIIPALAVCLASFVSVPARAQTSWNEDDFHFFQEEIFSPFFAERRDASGVYYFEVARRRAVPARFEVPKAFGTFRIFVVGESVAQRFAALELGELPPNERMSAVWSRLLKGRKVEVVPAAVPSYDSARVRMVLDEALRHEPDLIIVLTGNNENRDPATAPSRLYLWQRPMRRFGWFLRLGAWLRSGLPPPLLTRDEVVERYESNLNGMAKAAARRGVPLVFCALPRNLVDEPPGATLPLGDSGFFDGWWDWTNDDSRGAESALRRFVGRRPDQPFGWFYLGRVLRSLGRPDAAREAFLRAAELADTGIRPSMDESARRAAERGGAILADIDRAFREVAAGGLVGSEFFDDSVHWHESLNPLVNETIFAAVRRALPSLGWDESAVNAEKENVRLLLSGPRNSAEPARKALMNAVWAFNPDPLRNDELSVEAFDRVRRWSPAELRKPLTPEGREELRAAVAKNIWTGSRVERLDGLWPLILDDLGEMYRRSGSQRRAIRAFDESLKLDASRTLTRLRRGLAERAAGDCRRARADLDIAFSGPAELPELAHFKRALRMDHRCGPFDGSRAGTDASPGQKERSLVIRPDARVELVAVLRVLAETRRPPQGSPQDRIEYLRDVWAAFGRFQGHEAVKAYIDASAHGLDIQSALRLAWETGAATSPWRSWLYEKIGASRVERLVDAAERFRIDAGFDDFFRRHEPLLDTYARPLEGVDSIQDDRAIIEAYTGLPIRVRDEVVPSPLLPGPTGANFESGSDLVWIFGPERFEGGVPVFNWAERRWDRWHEWAHDELDGYADIYYDSDSDSKDQAGCGAPEAGGAEPCYGSWRSCVREHAAQVVADRIAAAHGLPRRPLPHLRWANAVFERLGAYESDRRRYPALGSFYAKLLSPVPGFEAARMESAAKKQDEAGRRAFQSGRIDEALSDFSRAVQSRPENPGFRQNYGVALIRAKKFSEAGLQLDEAVRMSTQPCGDSRLAAEAFSTRASLSLSLGRKEDAMEDLKRSLAVAPPDWGRRKEAEAQLSGLGGRP